MALTKISKDIVAINAIQGTLIADNAITAVHIATNAVSGTLIADNAVTATHIAQNVITVTQLADDAVEAAKIADGVITTNHLNKAMISSQTEVTAATGDFLLIGDTSDSNNLKKVPVSSILAGTLTTAAQTNITSLGTLTGLTGGTGDLVWDTTTLVVDSSADKVGIGTTSPTKTFSVIKEVSDDWIGIFKNDHADAYGMQIDLSQSTASTRLAFAVYTGAASTFAVNNQGKVGIGTTAPDDYNSHAENLVVASSGNTGISIVAGTSSDSTLMFADGTGGTAGYRGRVGYDHNTDAMVFHTAAAERMQIDSSGRVGINRTPAIANAKLEVGGADNVPLINVEASGSTAGIGIGSGHFQFYTGTTERWRIESGGKFYGTGQIQGGTVLMGGSNITYSGDSYSPIGTNSTSARLGFFRDFSASYPTLIFNTTDDAHFAPHDADMRVYMGSQGGDFGANSSNNLRPVGTSFYMNSGGANFVFERAGTGVGYIDASGFNDGSDEALKKDIADITYGLDTVKSLKPRKFKWKSNSEDSIGFIAQEVESIIPEVVSESNASGTPTSFKGLSYGHLTAVLVKAVQELEGRVKELEG